MIVSLLARMNAINTMNNSAYSWMNSSNSLMNLTSFAGGYQNLNSLHQAEQNLQLSMLNDSFNYKVAAAQEKSLKKLSDDNIKRSFSTFA